MRAGEARMIRTLTAADPGLNRPEVTPPLPNLAGLRVLVTGSGGFLGQKLMPVLDACGAQAVGFDLPKGSVLDREALPQAEFCLHLAAHKYATTAEETPAAVAELNIRGTANVIDAFGPRCVVVSTCKAADPMTVYGASKLIAERVAMNLGARVVRLVNVLGSSGSVVELWRQVPRKDPLPVAPAARMWMSPTEAVHLIVAAVAWPSGRYALDVAGWREPVKRLADRLHPDRRKVEIPLRRGDREIERLTGEAETAETWLPGVLRITHPFD